jgi:hypothetical protein
MPVALVLLWGALLTKAAYVPLIYAYHLANQSGSGFAGVVPYLHSPLWTAVLTLASLLQLPLLPTSLLLGGIGWSVTAVLLTHSLLKDNIPLLIAYASGFLLIFNPIVTATVGQETGWLLAGVILAVWLNNRHGQTLVLLLLPLLFFDWSTVGLTAVLLLYRGYKQQKMPVMPILSFFLIVVGWAAVSQWRFGVTLPPITFPFSIVQNHYQQLLSESELYWLFLPFLLLGLFASWQKPFLWFTLILGSLALLTDGAVATAVLTLLTLWLTGTGIGWLWSWVPTRYKMAGSWQRFLGVATAVLLLPLFIAQTSSLWQRYQTRPLATKALNQQIGQWLRQNSATATAVFTTADIAFSAQRPLWHWTDEPTADLTTMLNQFIANPPDYFVARHTLPWQQITQTGWFQERYQAVQSYQSAYEATSPFVIWQYQPSAFDDGPSYTAQIHSHNGLQLTGYQYSPATITPGEAVHVTLFWQATRPLTTTFHTVVRIVSTVDQSAWAQRDLHSPRSLTPDWIGAGDHFAERFVLTTTADIPLGSYELNFSLYTAQSPDFVNLYENDDVTPIDRVTLGYLAVPWQGDVAATAVPLHASYSDQIKLTSYTLEGDLMPGSTILATLYWQALRSPDDDYTIFVHVLDEQGQFITSHDGQPMNGRYLTLAWQPNSLIADEHPLTLPTDLPPGRYHLSVGLYLLETGVRLPVTAADGTPQANDAFSLPPFTINP